MKWVMGEKQVALHTEQGDSFCLDTPCHYCCHGHGHQPMAPQVQFLLTGTKGKLAAAKTAPPPYPECCQLSARPLCPTQPPDTWRPEPHDCTQLQPSQIHAKSHTSHDYLLSPKLRKHSQQIFPNECPAVLVKWHVLTKILHPQTSIQLWKAATDFVYCCPLDI